MDEWDLSIEDSYPTDRDTAARHFKWAWNEEHGALVWAVSGPGDGRPFHEARVRAEWGRGPRVSLGDVPGIATYAAAQRDKPEMLSIHVYFAANIPAAVRRWFDEAFPHARKP